MIFLYKNEENCKCKNVTNTKAEHNNNCILQNKSGHIYILYFYTFTLNINLLKFSTILLL